MTRGPGGGREYAGTLRVERVVWSGDNGFRIVKAECTKTRATISLKGTLHDVVRGSIVEVTGRWVQHPKFGEQVEVATCSTSPPEDKDGAAVYLAGHPRVSEPLARRIVAELGSAEALWRALEDPARLAEVRGVGVKLAADLCEWYRQSRDERETVTALASWGLNRRQVRDAVAALGPVARARGARVEVMVKANPWLLAEEVDGVGVQTCDEIAARLRIDPNCVPRARAGLLCETLRADNREGHCYTDRDDAVARTARSLPVERDLVRAALEELVAEGKVVLEGERVWRAPLLAAERRIAEAVAQRTTAVAAVDVVDAQAVRDAIEEACAPDDAEVPF